MTRLKSFIRKYFGFSEGETNGFVLLIPLTVLLLFAPSVTKKILISFYSQSDNSDEKLLKQWVKEIEENIYVVEDDSFKIEKFRFDPNNVSVLSLQKLGFSKKTAERIENYRAAGGRFKSANDLLKIYGISKERVKTLTGYIVIPKRKNIKSNTAKKSKPRVEKKIAEKVYYSFELNKVSKDSLMKIKGIGPFFAKNIIEYRDKLGGFVSFKQLKNVFGINEHAINRVIENTTLNPELVKPININSDSIKVLLRHPYISYKIAKTIIAYRDQHGDYEKIEEIKNIKLVSDSLFLRLEPYLGLGNN